jgi:hypothetical protein
MLVTPVLPQSRQVFQLVQVASKGSQRGFLQVFKCGMERHVTFLERGNYFGNLYQIASPTTLSRGNPTLERKLTREIKSKIAPSCSSSISDLPAGEPVRRYRQHSGWQPQRATYRTSIATATRW